MDLPHFLLIFDSTKKPAPLPAWPMGTDGALNIVALQTVNLAAGSVKDYSSITILPGGILNITGSSNSPTIIGCLGNFNNLGTIQGIDDGRWGQPLLYSGVAPDSHAIRYSPSSGNGGNAGGNASYSGGYSNYGNGGGGGGASNGSAATANGGGNGAAGTGVAYAGPGGANFSSIGGAGGGYNSQVINGYGGGGGGASRGQNGQVVYFNVKGNIINAGTMLFKGADAGAYGGSGGYCTSGYGGGGGGGSAGGFGGYVCFRVHGMGSGTLAAGIIVNGGSQGSGGTGGHGGGGGGGYAGGGGTGDLGADGIIVVSNY